MPKTVLKGNAATCNELQLFEHDQNHLQVNNNNKKDILRAAPD